MADLVVNKDESDAKLDATHTKSRHISCARVRRYDVEVLLSSRTRGTGFWSEEQEVGAQDGNGGSGRRRPASPTARSALPPALERVFTWLEEMEGDCDQVDVPSLRPVQLQAPYFFFRLRFSENLVYSIPNNKQARKLRTRLH